MTTSVLIKKLVLALGESNPSNNILDAIVEIGAGFVETKSMVATGFYWEFFTKGICFIFENNKLKQVSLYLNDSGQYKAFSGNIFANYKGNRINLEELEKLMDSNYEQGGGEYSLIGYIEKWYKFEIDNNYIRFEISEHDGLVNKIHLIRK